MKKVLIGVGVVVLVVAGALAYLAGNLDDLVKQAVEDIGSDATGAEVSVSEVEISLTGGTARLGGFRVGNPAGFDSDYAFNLGGVAVTLNTDEISKELIHVTRIDIDAPQLIYEVDGSASNVSSIQKNVESYAQRYGGGSSPDSSSGEDGPKLIIDDVYIRDAEVSVAASFLKGQSVGTSLPDIHLEDIGKDGGGATPAEVTERIISAITAQMNASVSALDIDGLVTTINDSAAKALEGGQDAAAGMADEATKAVEDATKGIGESINNLLGN